MELSFSQELEALRTPHYARLHVESSTVVYATHKRARKIGFQWTTIRDRFQRKAETVNSQYVKLCNRFDFLERRFKVANSNAKKWRRAESLARKMEIVALDLAKLSTCAEHLDASK